MRASSVAVDNAGNVYVADCNNSTIRKVTSAGVVGSITYPPLMGLIAGVAGLGAGMIGVAVLILFSGATVAAAGRLGHPTPPRSKSDLL